MHNEYHKQALSCAHTSITPLPDPDPSFPRKNTGRQDSNKVIRAIVINMSDGNETTSLSTSSGGGIVNDVVAVIDVGRIKHAAAFDRAINVSS